MWLIHSDAGLKEKYLEKILGKRDLERKERECVIHEKPQQSRQEKITGIMTHDNRQRSISPHIRHHTSLYYTTQHNTTQHNPTHQPIQHSTAQHSTLLCTKRHTKVNNMIQQNIIDIVQHRALSLAPSQAQPQETERYTLRTALTCLSNFGSEFN